LLAFLFIVICILPAFLGKSALAKALKVTLGEVIAREAE
jgi:hypothetical protein